VIEIHVVVENDNAVGIVAAVDLIVVATVGSAVALGAPQSGRPACNEHVSMGRMAVFVMLPILRPM
jgi:hypothetical protein